MMKIRSNGILLPIQSLPSRYGIGDLGPEAREFVRFLHAAGQHVWQILPVTPTEAGHGHSPYHSPSAFAFNPLLISPEQLAEDGFVSGNDLPDEIQPDEIQSDEIHPDKMQAHQASDRIDYAAAWAGREPLFLKAFELHRKDPDFEAFCEQNKYWLHDYALFSVLTRHYKDHYWQQWPHGLARREPDALAGASREFSEPIARACFLQYLFYRQWTDFRRFCSRHEIRLMGDMPIYVPLHSADTWCWPELFRLDENFRPEFVSGVPPDYFSDTGQLWGHPVYNWEAHEKSGFDWWTRRIRHHLNLFDILRIDHFRGLVASWEVPANESSALNGKWRDAPVHAFLSTLHKRLSCLPLVAEDLGYITADVREVMRHYDLPGMRVLMFGFTDDPARNPNAPHNVEKTSVVYTGTHDTNTAYGWFDSEASETERKRACAYFGTSLSAKNFARLLVRIAMMSPASLCILPLQDLLCLGEQARINHPGKNKGNWLWKLAPGQLTSNTGARLANLTKIYGRR